MSDKRGKWGNGPAHPQRLGMKLSFVQLKFKCKSTLIVDSELLVARNIAVVTVLGLVYQNSISAVAVVFTVPLNIVATARYCTRYNRCHSASSGTCAEWEVAVARSRTWVYQHICLKEASLAHNSLSSEQRGPEHALPESGKVGWTLLEDIRGETSLSFPVIDAC